MATVYVAEGKGDPKDLELILRNQNRNWQSMVHKVKSSPLTIFLNKVLLEHSHPLKYCLWLLSCYKGRGEMLRKRSYGWSTEPKIFTLQPFSKKNLVIPTLEEFMDKIKHIVQEKENH